MRWILTGIAVAFVMAAGAAPSAAQIRFEVQPMVGWYEPTRNQATATLTDESGQEIGYSVAGRGRGALLGLRAAVGITDHFGVEVSGHRAWNRFAVRVVSNGVDDRTSYGPDWHIDALTLRPYARFSALTPQLSVRLKAGLGILRPDVGIGAVTRYAASIGGAASWALGSNLDLVAGADSYVFRFNAHQRTQNDIAFFAGVRLRSRPAH